MLSVRSDKLENAEESAFLDVTPNGKPFSGIATEDAKVFHPSFFTLNIPTRTEKAKDGVFPYIIKAGSWGNFFRVRAISVTKRAGTNRRRESILNGLTGQPEETSG